MVVRAMIYLSDNILGLICHHSQVDYPDECCGILIGRNDRENKKVHIVYPVANSAGINKSVHFCIDPLETIQAELLAEQNNLEIVGFYHSHPDNEASVSAEDMQFMIPGYSYPIISVRNGSAAEIRCYVKSDNTLVCEEPIIKER